MVQGTYISAREHAVLGIMENNVTLLEARLANLTSIVAAIVQTARSVDPLQVAAICVLSRNDARLRLQ